MAAGEEGRGLPSDKPSGGRGRHCRIPSPANAPSSSAYRSARTRWELEVDRARMRAILNERPAAIPCTKGNT